MEHLRKWIGLYLTAMILPFMFGYGVSEEHPVWVWWLIFVIVVWKVPPYSIGDRFWGKIALFYEWLFQVPMRWLKKAPKWFQYSFVIVMIILFEEFIFSPLGKFKISTIIVNIPSKNNKHNKIGSSYYPINNR